MRVTGATGVEFFGVEATQRCAVVGRGCGCWLIWQYSESLRDTRNTLRHKGSCWQRGRGSERESERVSERESAKTERGREI